MLCQHIYNAWQHNTIAVKYSTLSTWAWGVRLEIDLVNLGCGEVLSQGVHTHSVILQE